MKRTLLPRIHPQIKNGRHCIISAEFLNIFYAGHQIQRYLNLLFQISIKTKNNKTPITYTTNTLFLDQVNYNPSRHSHISLLNTYQ